MGSKIFLWIFVVLIFPVFSLFLGMDTPHLWMQFIDETARATGSNTLKVADAFSMSGQQVTLQVTVKNDDIFNDYQLELVLPPCLAMVAGSEQLTERAQDHMLSCELIGSNIYRFIAVSTTKQPFLGHSGAILRLTCQVNGNIGSYAMTPQNIILLNASYQNILTGYQAGVFTIYSQPARLRLKAWLEGWYNNGTMRTDLRALNVLPWNSPYPQAARTATNLPADIADWALLELRLTPNGDPIYQQSFLWKNNGLLCEMNGTTTDLTLNLPEGSYYIVLHHRNHCSAMSATAKTLSSVTVVYHDFSLAASQYYGQGGKMIVSGVWALPSGDINNDAAISSRDYVAWYQRQFLSPPPGYYDEDINGDGAVNNNDFLLWQTNARAGWRSTLP